MRKVGELVTIKNPLLIGDSEMYGEYCVIPLMVKYAGMKAKITSIIRPSERSGGGCYHICIGYERWGWTDKMFEDS